MNNFNELIRNRNEIKASKIFYHGSKPSVVKQLVDGEMEVNQIFHVTDDVLVAAAYAGEKGSVMAVAVNEDYGVQSRISMSISAHINGKNQWVMSADEANEMLDNAEVVLAIPVWAVRKAA